MQLAAIFLRGRRDMDHVPDPRLPRIVAEEHRQELADVEAIRLRAPRAPRDFNTRRIHHLACRRLAHS